MLGNNFLALLAKLPINLMKQVDKQFMVCHI